MAEAVPFRPYMLSGNGTVRPVQEVPSGCSAAAGFVRETARRSLVGNMGKQPNREEAPVHEPRACIPSITSTKDVSIIVIALTGNHYLVPGDVQHAVPHRRPGEVQGVPEETTGVLWREGSGVKTQSDHGGSAPIPPGFIALLLKARWQGAEPAPLLLPTLDGRSGRFPPLPYPPSRPGNCSM